MMRPFLFAAVSLLLLAAALASYPQGVATVQGKVAMPNGFKDGATPVASRRVSTGTILLLTRADVTVIWTATFADEGYTAICTVEDTTVLGLGMRVERIRSKLADRIVVQVINDANTNLTATLHCIAIHDF